MCEYINEAMIQEDFIMEKTIYDESDGLRYELRKDAIASCAIILTYFDATKSDFLRVDRRRTLHTISF